MKNKCSHFFLLVFCLLFSAQAKFEYKDPDIKTIVDKGAILAQTYLAKDKESLKGLTLLKLVRAHNPFHPTVGLLDNSLEFKRTISQPKNLTSSRSYARNLLFKAKKIKTASGSEEQMFLYFYVASLLDSGLAEAKKELASLKKAGMDPAKELDFLVESLPKDMVKEVEEAKPVVQVVEKEVKDEEEEKPQSSSNKKIKTWYGEAPVEKIKTILGEYHFESFRYSRVTVLDAINQLTQRLYSHGIKFSFKSNRISVLEERVALNGATYYFGPILPRYDGYDFSFTDTYFRDIIDHVCVQNDFDYIMRDGEIKLRDMRYNYISGQPQDGWDVEVEYPKFKKKFVSQKKKFEKRFIKVNAYATGVKLKSKSNKNAYITLNGGGGRLTLKEGSYDEDALLNLKRAISDLKKDNALELPVKTRTEIEDKEERVKGKYKWSSEVELVFFAKMTRFDSGKGMLFENPYFLQRKEFNNFITIRHPNKRDKEEAKERDRL